MIKKIILLTILLLSCILFPEISLANDISTVDAIFLVVVFFGVPLIILIVFVVLGIFFLRKIRKKNKEDSQRKL
ncbi:MAG: hypothetical protein PHF44_02480 [Candidatus Pacebacteria bacterium]|nr:hypothetical protein [Candidatus Paceibacterota bacterium]